jgi:hypothetical protein
VIYLVIYKSCKYTDVEKGLLIYPRPPIKALPQWLTTEIVPISLGNPLPLLGYGKDVLLDYRRDTIH